MHHGIGRRRERGKKRDDEQTLIYMYKRGERLGKSQRDQRGRAAGLPVVRAAARGAPWLDRRALLLLDELRVPLLVRVPSRLARRQRPAPRHRHD